jgi:hypothetical protein
VAGPWIFGDDEGIPSGQGQRSDLEAVKRRLDDGETEKQVAEAHFSAWCRYYRAFKRYKSLSLPARDWEMEVITLVGETGVGKSRWARERFPGAYYLPFAKASGCYWDFYEGQETVVVEEMTGARFSYTFLLALVDRYPMHIPVSGDHIQFSSRRIIFTSNSSPDEWYDPLKYPYQNSPLQRRLSQGESRVFRVDNGGVLVLLEGAPVDIAQYHPVPRVEVVDDNNNNNNN